MGKSLRLAHQLFSKHLKPRSDCSRIRIAFATPDGYGRMLSTYQNTLSGFVGPTKVMACGNTLQVKDYNKYDWTMFDPEAKKSRHEAVFPEEKQKAFVLGVQIVSDLWQQAE